MKCKEHKVKDAIGVCISCGSGLCKKCLISVKGISYCKPCLEGGRIRPGPTQGTSHPPPTRTPQPIRAPRPVRIPQSTRRPIRPLFYLGAVGVILLIFSMILYVSLQYVAFLEETFLPSIITASMLVLISSVITGIGFFGYWWNYGLRTSLAAFICTLIFSWWLLLGETLLGTYLGYFPLIIRDIGIAAFGVMLEVWATAIGEVSLFDVNEWLARICKFFLSLTALLFFFTCVLGIASDVLIGPGPIEFAIMFRAFMIILLSVGVVFLIPGGILGIIILATTKYGLVRIQSETPATTSTEG